MLQLPPYKMHNRVHLPENFTSIILVLCLILSQTTRPVAAIQSGDYKLEATTYIVGNDTAGKEEFRLGVFAPGFRDFSIAGLNLNATLVSLEMTIKKWQPIYLPNHFFKLVYLDTDCDFNKHSMSAARMYFDFSIQGLFGPMCPTLLSWTYKVCENYDLPMTTVGVAYGGNINPKGYVSLMPQFLYDKHGSNGKLPDFAYAINQTLMHFDWDPNFALIYLSTRPDNFYRTIILAFSSGYNFLTRRSGGLDQSKVELFTEALPNGAHVLKKFDNTTTSFQSWTRVIVVSMEAIHFRDMMWKLFHDLKLPIEEYVILCLDNYHPLAGSDWIQPWRDVTLPLNHEKNQILKHFFRHVLYFRMQPVISGAEKLETVRAEYSKACEQSDFSGCELPPLAEHLQFPAATSDGLRLFMQAMNFSIETRSTLLRTGDEKLPIHMGDFRQFIAHKTFAEDKLSYSSSTYDNYGKRVTLMNVWRMWDTESGNFSVHVTYKLNGTNETFAPGVPWISGQVPKTPPDCGYENEKCREPDRLKYIITFSSLACCLFVIVIMVLGFFVYRKVKLEEELMKMIWKIKHDELDFSEWKPSVASPESQLKHHSNTFLYQKNSNMKKISAVSSAIHASHKSSVGSAANLAGSAGQSHLGIGRFSVSVPPGRNSPSIFAIRRISQNQSTMALEPKEGVSVAPGTAFENMVTSTRPEPRYVFARYKKMKVAARPLKDTVQFELNRKRLIELKNLKSFTSEHVVRFIGCTVDQPRYIVYENCDKGSLYNFLRSPMKADLSFRFSLMLDIAKGLHFLAQNGMFHGRLNAKTCVLDHRFVCKIGDHGLYSLRPLPVLDLSQPDLRLEDKYYVKYVYVAPEILRRGTLPSSHEMQQSEFTHIMQRADCYSFAIICHEILYQKQPFHITNLEYTHKQKIMEVIKGGKNPFRPMFDDSDFTEELETYEKGVVETMRSRLRNARHVIELCWAENPHDRPDMNWVCSKLKENVPDNIMENMLQRMDKYAKTMESLVEEKAKHVVLEKKRADDLLYSILPVAIATKLIRNEKVESEWFDEATIYFSDIVGFTALSGSSSAEQVVDLLNSLYTLFDNITEEFDVYKVETIGDAYMVVSGIPIRNGSTHSYNIAAMSLKLLEAVINDFVIPHRPDEKLKLRIGLHTGPACAGVVGTKMPRYCLFGDTVNTASRMESNGEPLKIHISEQCKASLVPFNEFIIDYRGEIEMKGKGSQKTYWLRGRKSELVAKHPKLADLIGGTGDAPNSKILKTVDSDFSITADLETGELNRGNGMKLTSSAPAASFGPPFVPPSHKASLTPLSLSRNSILEDSVFECNPSPVKSAKSGRNFFSSSKNKVKHQRSSELADSEKSSSVSKNLDVTNC